jgi:hypothetical protein
LGRSITIFDVGRDSGAILPEPLFLIVELAHRFFDEIIGGFIGPETHIPPNKRLNSRLPVLMIAPTLTTPSIDHAIAKK